MLCGVTVYSFPVSNPDLLCCHVAAFFLWPQKETFSSCDFELSSLTLIDI